MKTEKTELDAGEGRKNRRKALRKKKGVTVAVIVLTLFLAMIAAFFAVPAILSSGRSNIGYENENASEALQNGDGFVFSVDSGTIDSLNNVSGGGVISAGNSILSFKRNGSVSDAVKTGYSSQSVKFSGSDYIVFERSTGKYSIMDKNGTVHSSQLDEEIINAAVSSGGEYIIISRKSLSTSFVTVYSTKNTVLFRWECSTGYLTDCAISPNGKNFAVAEFDVKNGNSKTVVRTFTTKSTDVEKEIEISGAVFSMKFLTSDSLGIITDSGYIIENVKSGETKTADYALDNVSASFFSDNNYAAVLKSDFGSLGRNSISVFDRSANEIFSREIDEEVISFFVDKSFVYVMTSCKITVYALSTGEEHASYETVGGLRRMCVLSGRIFCATDTDVYKYGK